MPKIIIDITPDGPVTVDAQEFTGTDCQDATRAIERALGLTTQDDRKREFSQRTVRNQQEKHQR